MRLTRTQAEQIQTIVSQAAVRLAGLSWSDVEAASAVPRSWTEMVWSEIEREDFMDLLEALGT